MSAVRKGVPLILSKGLSSKFSPVKIWLLEVILTPFWSMPLEFLGNSAMVLLRVELNFQPMWRTGVIRMHVTYKSIFTEQSKDLHHIFNKGRSKLALWRDLGNPS